ncbi:MAG: hypothetical protein ACLUAL_18990 [Blautia wexlerae]
MKAKYVWRFKLELRRTEIWIYRQKKQKGKISLKTLIMFLINLIFYAMVTGTNYHRTHPGESKFQAGITYNNVRIFIYSIVFCLGLAIMKKMKKLASKWIITWAILCTVFLIVMSFCEIENAYVSFSTADQAEKYYGIEKNKIDEIYGEDSIEVLYLEDRQMNSKIIYKEEGGWKCTSHSEIKCLYNRADFKKDNTIVVRECTITGELYISVICGKKDNKDFQISDTQNTIFTKKNL